MATVLSAWALGGSLGCSSAPAPAAAPAHPARSADDLGEIIIEEGFNKDARGQAWTSYGRGRAAMWHARDEHKELHNHSGDNFDIELEARGAAAKTWSEARKNDPKLADAYLDVLVRVVEAGFLDEYIVTYLARPGWTIFGDAVGAFDFPAFRSWAKDNLKKHEVETHALFKPPQGFEMWAAQPGADLPAASKFLPPVGACAATLPQLREAAVRWDAQAKAIDGLPLAAANREELTDALTLAKRDAAFLNNGATWVAGAAADLAFARGYCASSVNESGEAETALRAAIRLAPHIAGNHGELASVLSKRRALDEADREIDQALALADRIPCERARSLRHRGYLLVERGKLVDAYHVYLESLDVAPGNELAMRELSLIRAELGRRGSKDLTGLGEYVPPAAASVVTTSTCPRYVPPN